MRIAYWKFPAFLIGLFVALYVYPVTTLAFDLVSWKTAWNYSIIGSLQLTEYFSALLYNWYFAASHMHRWFADAAQCQRVRCSWYHCQAQLFAKRGLFHTRHPMDALPAVFSKVRDMVQWAKCSLFAEVEWSNCWKRPGAWMECIDNTRSEGRKSRKISLPRGRLAAMSNELLPLSYRYVALCLFYPVSQTRTPYSCP